MFGVARLNTLAKAAAAPSGVRVTNSTWTTNYSGTGGSASAGKFGNAIATVATSNNYHRLAFGNTSAGATYWQSTTPMCIEFWMYISFTPSNSNQCVWATNSDIFSSLATAGGGDLSLSWNTSQGTWKLYDGSASTLVNLTIPTATWQHFALQVNSSGRLSIWQGGTLRVNNVVYSTSTNQPAFYVGKGINGSNNNSVRFDEFRVTYGTRYTGTSSLTVPTAAFVNDATTLGLFHCESTTQTDDTA